MEQKRKEEIRKSIIACDNDIVKLRSQAENLEEIINDLKKEFCDYTFEQIYGSMIKIIQELVEKNFLMIIS